MDDRHLITENTCIRTFKNIGHILSSEFFENVDGFNFYRPLVTLSNMFDYSIWKLNPFGYHLTNCILHFIVTFLIYMLLFHFFKSYSIALFLSLVYSTHPSATEAIAYIPGRAEPLALIFLLLSFLLFIYFWQSQPQKWAYYILSVTSLFLACLSKETAVVFPAFLFLYSLTSDKNKSCRLKNKILTVTPYFLTALSVLFLRYIILKNAGGSFINTSATALYIRIINAPLLIPKYIWMFICPRPFVFEQSLTHYASFFNPFVLSGLVSTILLIVLMSRFYRSRIALGGMWFLAFIFPVSGIVPINALLHHHWLYIPSVGLLIILGELLLKLNKILKGSYYNKVAFRYLPMFSGVIILLFFSTLTIEQNGYFKDEVTFYKKTIEKAPQSYRMHHNLGLVYLEKGLYETAIAKFKKAIELNPDSIYPYVNLGYVYQAKNFTTAAERIFKRAVKIKPSSYLPYCYLAKLYSDTGRFSESIELYKKAIFLKPKNPVIYYNLAVAYDKNGNAQDSIKAYQKNYSIEPRLYKSIYKSRRHPCQKRRV